MTLRCKLCGCELSLAPSRKSRPAATPYARLRGKAIEHLKAAHADQSPKGFTRANGFAVETYYDKA